MGPLALMLVYPIGLTTRRGKLGCWLDAATVLVATAVLGRRRRRYSPLPYLAVALTHGVLVAALAARHIDGRLWGVLIGVVAITTMVVLRQLTAFADNSRLLLEVSRQEQRFRSLV